MDSGLRRNDGQERRPEWRRERRFVATNDCPFGQPPLRRLDASANESEKTMELILIQKVKNLGNLGDKVRVKPGYGRNFLVPQGKAVAATATNLAEFEKRRADYEAKANQQLSAADVRKEQLEGKSITIKANASPEGKLFGSVGPRDIADAFTAAGVAIEKSEVVMGEGPLRHIGEFEVQIHLHADVNTTVKVVVVADE
jgi:large subunit ribosomal protein L9